MAKKTIMLACTAGMSTSMLVKKMQDTAKTAARITKSLQHQRQMLMRSWQAAISQMLYCLALK